MLIIKVRIDGLNPGENRARAGTGNGAREGLRPTAIALINGG